MADYRLKMYANRRFREVDLMDDRPLLLVREKNTCIDYLGAVLRYAILPSLDTCTGSFSIHHVREFPIGNVLASTDHINENPQRKYHDGFPLKIVDVTRVTRFRVSPRHSGAGHFSVFYNTLLTVKNTKNLISNSMNASAVVDF